MASKKMLEGLGDTVEKVLKVVLGTGYAACEGCKRRKKKLNKMFPYKK